MPEKREREREREGRYSLVLNIYIYTLARLQFINAFFLSFFF